jgi:hypothetical protein
MSAVIVVIRWSFSVFHVLYGCFNWCGCACSFVSGWHLDCGCPCPQRRYPRQCLQFLTIDRNAWGCLENPVVCNLVIGVWTAASFTLSLRPRHKYAAIQLECGRKRCEKMYV